MKVTDSEKSLNLNKSMPILHESSENTKMTPNNELKKVMSNPILSLKNKKSIPISDTGKYINF